MPSERRAPQLSAGEILSTQWSPCLGLPLWEVSGDSPADQASLRSQERKASRPRPHLITNQVPGPGSPGKAPGKPGAEDVFSLLLGTGHEGLEQRPLQMKGLRRQQVLRVVGGLELGGEEWGSMGILSQFILTKSFRLPHLSSFLLPSPRA